MPLAHTFVPTKLRGIAKPVKRNTALATLIGMNADQKFGKCKEIAVAVANEIPDSIVIYGLYFPVTPRERWDRRWRDSEFFTHFWVQVDGRIIDAAKEQFGEPFVSIIPLDDVRYVKIGMLNQKSDKIKQLVKEPRINWGSLTDDPLNPAKVIWEGYNDHMKLIEELRAS